MDATREVGRAKWLLIALAVLLISGCLSYGEAIYWIGGEDVQADITKVSETQRRRRWIGQNRKRLIIEYAFAEPNGARRTGSDTVSRDWPGPKSGKVGVRYTPGENGSSRLAGEANWIALALFGLSAAAVVVFVGKLYLEARAATREPKRRRRRDREI